MWDFMGEDFKKKQSLLRLSEQHQNAECEKVVDEFLHWLRFVAQVVSVDYSSPLEDIIRDILPHNGIEHGITF
jgi:hypothetical protein